MIDREGQTVYSVAVVVVGEKGERGSSAHARAALSALRLLLATTLTSSVTTMCMLPRASTQCQNSNRAFSIMSSTLSGWFQTHFIASLHDYDSPRTFSPSDACEAIASGCLTEGRPDLFECLKLSACGCTYSARFSFLPSYRRTPCAMSAVRPG